MADRSLFERVVPVCGGAVLVIGSYLPWVRPNPGRADGGDAVPDILLPEMNAGFEALSIALLVAAALAVVVSVVDRDGGRRTSAAVVLLAGVGAVLLPIGYLVSTPLVGFDGTFAPTYGWYLTICGGLVLAVAGLAQLSPATLHPNVESES